MPLRLSCRNNVVPERHVFLLAGAHVRLWHSVADLAEENALEHIPADILSKRCARKSEETPAISGAAMRDANPTILATQQRMERIDIDRVPAAWRSVLKPDPAVATPGVQRGLLRYRRLSLRDCEIIGDDTMQQPQRIQPFVPCIAFHHNRETAPAYWLFDVLWLVLADGRETGGAYSVIEQLMPQGSGPPVPHIHPIDEWFYVIEGELTVKLGGQTIAGRGGDFLWIPRGTVHLFTVTSQLCRVLNGYTPAGVEQVFIGLAEPAQRRELPPPKGKPDQVTIDKLFNNYWCAEAKDDWSLSRMGIR
jgi:quercetin dioxygenase-like cupin family protein